MACWVKIAEFRSIFSEKSRPKKSTVISWINDPENVAVRGRKVGRDWYIDLEHFNKSTGDALADRILAAAA